MLDERRAQGAGCSTSRSERFGRSGGVSTPASHVRRVRPVVGRDGSREEADATTWSEELEAEAAVRAHQAVCSPARPGRASGGDRRAHRQQAAPQGGRDEGTEGSQVRQQREEAPRLDLERPPPQRIDLQRAPPQHGLHPARSLAAHAQHAAQLAVDRRGAPPARAAALHTPVSTVPVPATPARGRRGSAAPHHPRSGCRASRSSRPWRA
jgi:hypothetical protein